VVRVDVSPPASSAAAQITQPSTSIAVSVAPAHASASTTPPSIGIAVTAPSGDATAGAGEPFYGGGLDDYLRSARRAFSIQRVLIEADLITAEASLNAALTAAERYAAQDVLDYHAARATYVGQSLDEVDRALSLSTMYADLIGAP
jgi:hypothetical protein